MLLSCSLCLLLLSCLSELVESRALSLDSCSVNVHTNELRSYYTEIRSDAIAGDSEIGVKLLERSKIKDIQEGQTCCFLRLVLGFYVDSVFGNFASSHPQQQRCSSALANAFVSIRRDTLRCHCLCDEGTQSTIESLHAEFVKLQINQAAQKAVAELDTVLDWLEALDQSK
ncbi:interleukin 19 like [Aulostomus maculatus]